MLECLLWVQKRWEPTAEIEHKMIKILLQEFRVRLLSRANNCIGNQRRGAGKHMMFKWLEKTSKNKWNSHQVPPCRSLILSCHFLWDYSFHALQDPAKSDLCSPFQPNLFPLQRTSSPLCLLLILLGWLSSAWELLPQTSQNWAR